MSPNDTWKRLATGAMKRPPAARGQDRMSVVWIQELYLPLPKGKGSSWGPTFTSLSSALGFIGAHVVSRVFGRSPGASY